MSDKPPTPAPPLRQMRECTQCNAELELNSKNFVWMQHVGDYSDVCSDCRSKNKKRRRPR